MGTQQGLAWSDIYKTGHENVDDQHKRIFKLLSDLVAACEDGSGDERLKETIEFLVNYTVEHFYDEESVQVQWNFPEYRQHKQLHEDFKATVVGIVGKYNESGSSEELNSDVNKIIVKWIVNHIQKEDKKIGEHIRRTKAEQNIR